jgi:DHA2 family methylenomycin A resistance protein-like MFS transporter
MMPLDLFRSPAVTAAVTVGFAFAMGYFGLPFVMSCYLQQVRGLTSLAAGTSFPPMMLTEILLTSLSARITERLGPRLLIATGLALMGASLAGFASVPATTPVPVLTALMIPVGVAAPLIMPPVTAVLLGGVLAHRSGTAGGVFNTSRQVGGSLAVAVFGALLGNPSTFLAGLRISS